MSPSLYRNNSFIIHATLNFKKYTCDRTMNDWLLKQTKPATIMIQFTVCFFTSRNGYIAVNRSLIQCSVVFTWLWSTVRPQVPPPLHIKFNTSFKYSQKTSSCPVLFRNSSTPLKNVKWWSCSHHKNYRSTQVWIMPMSRTMPANGDG